jgi:hypothetical protein
MKDGTGVEEPYLPKPDTVKAIRLTRMILTASLFLHAG